MNNLRNYTKEQLIEKIELLQKKVFEVEESKEKTYKILQEIDDFVFVLDKDNRFVSVYGPKEKLFMQPDEFLGKVHQEIMPGYVDELFTAALFRTVRAQ